MAERVLCDEQLRVSLDGGGERTLLSIRDGTTIRFWADTAAMEEVLLGMPIQLSAYGGFCAMEVFSETVRLEFGLDGKGRKHCTFPVQELEDALIWVRGLASPVVGEPDALNGE
jgi:hypothetical protein